MYKIGLSTCGKEINEDLFRKYAQSGISAMEISVPDTVYQFLDYKNMKIWSERYGVDLWSYHLPYSPFDRIDISALSKEQRKRSIEYFSELMKKASDIGIDKYIVHPSGEPIPESDRAERLKCSKESIYELSKIAVSCGGKIMVEDLPRTCLGNCSDEVLELSDFSEGVGVCFDTNHLLFENPADFVKKLGKRICTVHVSDYDFVDEKHWLPGEGKIDWKELIQSIKDINYSGVWLYEIEFKCPNTITRDRDLACEDFVNNAKKLFE